METIDKSDIYFPMPCQGRPRGYPLHQPSPWTSSPRSHVINSSIACCGPSAVLSCRAALLWEGTGSHVMSQAKVGSSTFLASTGHPEKFSNLLSPAPPRLFPYVPCEGKPPLWGFCGPQETQLHIRTGAGWLQNSVLPPWSCS